MAPRTQADYSYPRLPRLPMEIIMEILFFTGKLFDAYMIINKFKTSSTGLEIENRGFLHQVIFDPHLLNIHYVNDSDIRSISRCTLKDIARLALKPTVLTDDRMTRSMRLVITIEEWPLHCRDMEILRTVVERFPHRCTYLSIQLPEFESENVTPMLDFCKPCYPYLKSIFARNNYTIEKPPVSSTLTRVAEGIQGVPGTMNLMRANLSIGILPSLLFFGALDRITDLYINTNDRHIQDLTLPILPEVLSSMPNLVDLSFENFDGDSELDLSALPKVKSKSLRHIRIWGGHSDGISELLPLFSECPIDKLDLDGEDPCLDELSEHFHGLKALHYYGCADLEVLLTKRIGGKLVFPGLEDVTFHGFSSRRIYGSDEIEEDSWKIHRAQDRELVLQIARSRSSTPGVAPLQRICIDTLIIDDCEGLDGFSESEFVLELEEYVPTVDWWEYNLIPGL